MSEIEKSLRTNPTLKICSAKLTFRKTKKDVKTVSIQISRSRGNFLKVGKFSFPDYLNENDLLWRSYDGRRISVYYRVGDNYKYLDAENSVVHTELSQKLERLVREYSLDLTKSSKTKI